MGKHGVHSPGTNPEAVSRSPCSRRRALPRLDRRRFLVWTAVGACRRRRAPRASGSPRSSGPDEHAGANEHPGNRPTSAKSRKRTSTLPDGVVVPTSAAILAENARTGHAWWVTTPQNAGDIEGFASRVSARVGDDVTLFVSTKAPQFHVEAYRMGYYQGIGARLVWQSAEVAGIRQPSPDAGLADQHHRMPVDALAHRDHRSHLAPWCVPAQTRRHGRRAAVRPAMRPRRHLEGCGRHPAERDHLAGLQPLGRLQPLLRQRGRRTLLHPRRQPAVPTTTAPVSCRSTGPTITTGRPAPRISSATSSRSSSTPRRSDSTSPTGRTSICTSDHNCSPTTACW